MPGSNDRQRRQAREKFRRQQELRIARQRVLRRRWITGVSVVAAVGLVAGLLLAFLPGGGKHPSASPKKSPTASASASARHGVGDGSRRARASLYLYGGDPGSEEGEPPAGHAGLYGELHGDAQHQPWQDHLQPAQQQGHLHGQLLCPPGRGRLLQQHPVPPSGEQRHLRAAVR